MYTCFCFFFSFNEPHNVHLGSLLKVIILIVLEFNKRIVERVLLLCEENEKTRDKYPELNVNPGHLTASKTRLDKQEAVQNFVSRFGRTVEPVWRPKGCEDVVVKAKVAKKKNKKKNEKNKKKNKKVEKRKARNNDDGEGSSAKRKKGRSDGTSEIKVHVHIQIHVSM